MDESGHLDGGLDSDVAYDLYGDAADETQYEEVLFGGIGNLALLEAGEMEIEDEDRYDNDSELYGDDDLAEDFEDDDQLPDGSSRRSRVSSRLSLVSPRKAKAPKIARPKPKYASVELEPMTKSYDDGRTLDLWGPNGNLRRGSADTKPSFDVSMSPARVEALALHRAGKISGSRRHLEVIAEPGDDELHEIDAESERWQDYANCLGVDTALFFPERGAGAKEAKGVCQGCVVREDCLESALEIRGRQTGEKFGIWGGLSERERRRIRRQRASRSSAE